VRARKQQKLQLLHSSFFCFVPLRTPFIAYVLFIVHPHELDHEFFGFRDLIS